MQKILIGLLAVCCNGAVLAGPATEPAALLVYRVVEPGAGAYISRTLVTDRYVRMDEGSNADGYTLFDRNKRVIYDVSPEDRTILVMDPRKVKIPPAPVMQLGVKDTADRQAPKIVGMTPHNLTLSVDGKRCNTLVVVPGLMPKALQAMRELRQVLARVQALSLSSQPASANTPCDLAENIYAPTRHLDYGLPIEQRDSAGQQSLVDFKSAYQVNPDLFTLPAGYHRMALPGLPIN